MSVPLMVAGCSTGYDALGTQTAQVLVNGSMTAEHTRVTCDQVQWVWFIDSVQESPGFTAQVRTGDTVAARLVRIENLGGFTGSSWNAAVTAPSTPSSVGADAEIADGTFTITGTAMGFYQDDPAEIATASFEIRTDC
ncbi:conserved lipoprotein/antigen [Mycolicibacterium aurum]|uniref:Conserved lipoprotein/antigen n=1 Tax=Mycolicibacterium aurum TaxID=1791 RepID=A0A448IPJ6_MYCAU|nr:lipoprotein LpqH [Mycolicibacterium aurum]VEG54359.1 conserved lipoprotein/antigen [Mycolicibacterium aurum]